jgi:hypothetical protein
MYRNTGDLAYREGFLAEGAAARAAPSSEVMDQVLSIAAKSTSKTGLYVKF